MAIRLCALIIGVGMASAALGRGPDWEEPRGGDVGKVPGTAGVPQGTGPLRSISGSIDGFFIGRPDYQDMYAIFIDDPDSFSAHTSGPPDGRDFDTMLWLFDGAGVGLLANDEVGIGSGFSNFRNMADDGSGAVVTQRGLYYIAISGFNSTPFSGDGDVMFSFASRVEVSGPDGPGGGAPITDWFSPGETGSYVINMTGVIFVPGPASGAAVAAALLVLRRRRGRR